MFISAWHKGGVEVVFDHVYWVIVLSSVNIFTQQTGKSQPNMPLAHKLFLIVRRHINTQSLRLNIFFSPAIHSETRSSATSHTGEKKEETGKSLGGRGPGDGEKCSDLVSRPHVHQ